MRELLLTVAIAGATLTSGAPSDSLYTAATTNPANTFATATSLWFGATGTGVLVCTGINTLLACPYPIVTVLGKYNASFTLRTKGAAVSYTVSIADSSGPAPISSITTATFASTGTGAATIAANTTDTIKVGVLPLMCTTMLIVSVVLAATVAAPVPVDAKVAVVMLEIGAGPLLSAMDTV